MTFTFTFCYKTIINLSFFLFFGFFTDFFLGFGLVFLLNFLINLFPSHRIRLQMITPPKNPPPPGFKMILRFTSGLTIALAKFRTSSWCLSINFWVCLGNFILPWTIFRAAKENHLIISIKPAFKSDFLLWLSCSLLKLYRARIRLADARWAILTQMMDLNSNTPFYTPGK